MRLIFIALLLATAAIYLTMVLWSLPLITIEADGFRPFDLRPFGYSLEEAEEFNNALSEEGRVFYLDTQHWIDTLFPALLAASLIWSALFLWQGIARWVVVGIAVIAAVADYLENAAVARLLDGFDPAIAAEANKWTLIKSASVTVVFLAILLALALRLGRRIRS